jgi:hypothetical protein
MEPLENQLSLLQDESAFGPEFSTDKIEELLSIEPTNTIKNENIKMPRKRLNKLITLWDNINPSWKSRISNLKARMLTFFSFINYVFVFDLIYFQFETKILCVYFTRSCQISQNVLSLHIGQSAIFLIAIYTFRKYPKIQYLMYFFPMSIGIGNLIKLLEKIVLPTNSSGLKNYFLCNCFTEFLKMFSKFIFSLEMKTEKKVAFDLNWNENNFLNDYEYWEEFYPPFFDEIPRTIISYISEAPREFVANTIQYSIKMLYFMFIYYCINLGLELFSSPIFFIRTFFINGIASSEISKLFWEHIGLAYISELFIFFILPQFFVHVVKPRAQKLKPLFSK